jgi:hypothetical protein
MTMITPYKEKDEGEGSDTSSTGSSSSSEGRKRSLRSSSGSSANVVTSPSSTLLGHSQPHPHHHQQHHEEDESWNDDDERAMGKGLLTNMETRTNPDDRFKYDDNDGIDARPSEVAKKRQQRRKIAAGVAGAAAGLVMLGPCTAVAAGVAGAMLIRRYDRKKQQEAKTLTDGENELASLISPRAEV